MTRSKTKALKKALNALVLNVSTKSELKGALEYQEETLVHLIHVQEGSNTTLFGPWGEDSKGNKRILLQLGNNMGGYLFLLFLGLRRAACKAINKHWISSIIFYFLLFFSWQNMDLILWVLFYFTSFSSLLLHFQFWNYEEVVKLQHSEWIVIDMKAFSICED